MPINQDLAVPGGRTDSSDFGIPSWLCLPPSGTVPPPVSTRPQVLPVRQLGWENFERLCLRLLQRTQEIEQVLPPGAAAGVTRLYGKRGQAQQGIDVYSRDPLPLDAAPPERPAVCLQSRRLQRVTKTGLKSAVSEFVKGTWAPTSRKFIYATSASGADAQFIQEIEIQTRRMAKAGIELGIWDEEEISGLLRDKPELIDDFFGRPWVEAFCGTEVVQRLGSRLDGEQVASLRAKVRRIYGAAFGLADPGIVAPSTTTSTAVPLGERFVTPDLRPLRAAEAYPNEPLASSSTDSGTDADGEATAHLQHDASYLFGEPVDRGRGSLDGDWLGFASSLGSSDHRPGSRRSATPRPAAGARSCCRGSSR